MMDLVTWGLYCNRNTSFIHSPRQETPRNCERRVKLPMRGTNFLADKDNPNPMTIWIHLYLLCTPGGKELGEGCTNRKPTYDSPIPINTKLALISHRLPVWSMSNYALPNFDASVWQVKVGTGGQNGTNIAPFGHNTQCSRRQVNVEIGISVALLA